MQFCKENRSPNAESCPVPEGGCRYVIWNYRGNWCHLAGLSCDLKNRKNRILVDTQPGMFFMSKSESQIVTSYSSKMRMVFEFEKSINCIFTTRTPGLILIRIRYSWILIFEDFRPFVAIKNYKNEFVKLKANLNCKHHVFLFEKLTNQISLIGNWYQMIKRPTCYLNCDYEGKHRMIVSGYIFNDW